MAEVLALIDYGAGNLHSVANALKAAGAEGVKVTADPDVVRAADRIVLPGVGSFKACAQGLRAIPQLVEAMTERVLVGGAPFLGICVGMQLLASRGVEHGVTPGLDWIGGEVRLIERTDPAAVRLQLDVGNMTLGGGDPFSYLARIPERYWSFHLKDVTRDGSGDTELGKGRIDFRRLLGIISDLDRKPCYVEQESPADEIVSARDNYSYIKGLTF